MRQTLDCKSNIRIHVLHVFTVEREKIDWTYKVFLWVDIESLFFCLWLQNFVLLCLYVKVFFESKNFIDAQVFFESIWALKVFLLL